MRKLIVVIVAAVMTGGCSIHAHVDVGSDEDDREAIAAVRAAYGEAMRTGDLDGVMQLMTDDIVIMFAGGEPVEGRQAVHDWTEWVFGQYHPDVKYTVDELEIDGDTAVERGGYDRGTTNARYGKRLWVYNRDDDAGWRLRYIMWSGN